MSSLLGAVQFGILVLTTFRYWYSSVLPADAAFPQACRKILTSFILSLSNNLARKRPADSFIEFTTNSSSILIVFLNELSAALSSSPNSSAADAIQTYLRMKPQCNLASLMDPKHQQRKLQMVADDVLESYLDPTVYRTCVTRVFLQKILAHVILEMTIEKCSRAEWINEWIVYLLEEGEPELMNVIDAGVEGSAAGQVTTTTPDTPAPEIPKSPVGRNHSRTVSKAEAAMDDAMREAKRLTQMIQDEEEKRQRERGQREQQHPPITNSNDTSDTSDGTRTHGIHTPTSSQSDAAAEPSEQLPQPHASSEPILDQQAPVRRHTHSKSVLEGEQPLEAASPHEQAAFTSFDQIAPSRVPTALTEEQQFALPTPEAELLTLHKATIVLFDDSQAGDRRAIKSKPTTDYLIQIEPASPAYPGWMIPRTYPDFETLHEVLVRISKITGVQFATLHPNLPSWKGATKPQLKDELERYLADAMRFEQLAESEGMKRFLEKSRGMTQENGKGFWPNPANVGKGMFDALAKAPNQVAGGGKAFFGGVAGVFTGTVTAGNKRQSASVPPRQPTPNEGVKSNNSSSVDLSKLVNPPKPIPERLSVDTDSLRKSLASSPSGNSRAALEPRRSESMKSRNGKSTSVSPRPSMTRERRSSNMMTMSDFSAPDTPSGIRLPPAPEDMPDEYDYSSRSAKSTTVSPKSATAASIETQGPDHVSHMSVDGTSFFDVPTPPTPRSPRGQSPAMRSPPSRHSFNNPRVRSPNPAARAQQQADAAEKAKALEARRTAPLSEQEAQVTIELLFAVITELYTLSSAWTLRRTLLGAAKTFLLRPGNPQLESIRVLLQETLLDANTNDSGIASHMRKLRENTLPTEEELSKWPKERTDDEKEALRVKARDLLVKRGMPQALTSVMGTAASGEALGKVFDCLQVQEVARGMMFGLLLQGVRGVTQ